MSGFEPAAPSPHRPANLRRRRRGKCATARRPARPTCGCSAATSCSTRPTRRLLVSLLPALMHVRGVERLLAAGAARRRGVAAEQRPGRELVLARLVEVLLIEALRAAGDERAAGPAARAGRCRAWRAALRQMHGDPARAVDGGAAARRRRRCRAPRSSSASRAPSGLPPMEYLLAWRMALAKDLLRRGEVGARRGGRARRLRLGQHVQHRVQPPCGAGAGALRARPGELALPQPSHSLLRAARARSSAG